MKVKDLIRELLNMPMDANVVVEVKTLEGWAYSSSEHIENVVMIDDERCLITE